MAAAPGDSRVLQGVERRSLVKLDSLNSSGNYQPASHETHRGNSSTPCEAHYTHNAV